MPTLEGKIKHLRHYKDKIDKIKLAIADGLNLLKRFL